jgi:hypothetical protein
MRGRVYRLPDSQSAVISLLSAWTIYILHVYAIYTRPRSVQAQYSRLCLIISSSSYNGSLVILLVLCLAAGTVSESKSFYDWRFTAHQFFLASSSLRPTTRDDFKWTLAVKVLMQHPLWREDGSPSYEYIWPFVKCTFRTYSMLLKNIPVALYTNPLSVQDFQSRSCSSYLCYNGSLVTWTVVDLATAKFKPLIFSMSGFTLPYTANMFILMILYDFCVLSAHFFLYNRIHAEGWKLCANRGPVCTVENFQWWAEPCFACAAILIGMCLSLIPSGTSANHYLSDKCLMEG